MTHVDQSHWDVQYARHEYRLAPPDDPLRRWLEDRMPQGRGAVLEVGCYPGRYLSLFGEAGYELHGIDLTPRVTEDFPAWLKARGYRVGRFAREDFWSFEPGRQYDVVASFGFIEHFENWEEAIKRHAAWVKPGGVLMLETPNFRGGLQRVLRQSLDADNVRRHCLEAMQPMSWARILETRGFRTEYAGYFGGFEFWTEPAARSGVQRLLVRAVTRLSSYTKGRLGDSAFYSAYCGYAGVLG